MHIVSGATSGSSEQLVDHPPRPQGGPPSFIGPIPLASGGSNCQMPPTSTSCQPSQAMPVRSGVIGTQPSPPGPARPASPHRQLGVQVQGARECLPPPSQTEQGSYSPRLTPNRQLLVPAESLSDCLSENLSQSRSRSECDNLVPYEKEVKSSFEHPLHRDTTREHFF